jgi:hypothetical protein
MVSIKERNMACIVIRGKEIIKGEFPKKQTKQTKSK